MFSEVVQLVERVTVTHHVVGSIPTLGAIMRVVRGIHLAFQAERRRFDACSPLHLSVLSARSDGPPWKWEVGGSNPPTQTSLKDAPVMELVYISDLKSEFCGFDSHRGHHV